MQFVQREFWHAGAAARNNKNELMERGIATGDITGRTGVYETRKQDIMGGRTRQVPWRNAQRPSVRTYIPTKTFSTLSYLRTHCQRTRRERGERGTRCSMHACMYDIVQRDFIWIYVARDATRQPAKGWIT